MMSDFIATGVGYVEVTGKGVQRLLWDRDPLGNQEGLESATSEGESY